MSSAPRDTSLVAAIETLGAEIVGLRAELRLAHEGGLLLRNALRARPDSGVWAEAQEYMRQYGIKSIGRISDSGVWYAQAGNAEYSGDTLRDAVLAAAEEWIAAQAHEAQV